MEQKTLDHVFTRRRHYLINKRLQLKALLGYGLVAPVAIGIATIFVIYLLLFQYAFEGGVTGSQLGNADWWRGFFVTMFWIAIFLIAIGCVVSIIMSHRVAGPLYRLKRMLRDVGDGQLNTELKFRSRDELHDLAEEFNNMLSGLRSRIETDRLRVGKIRAELQNISQLLRQHELAPEVQDQVIDKLAWTSQEMEELMTEFRLTAEEPS